MVRIISGESKGVRLKVPGFTNKVRPTSDRVKEALFSILADRVIDLFRKKGYSVEVNRPYSGSIVPLDYYQMEKRVSSIMIEINRELYMDEKTGEKTPSFIAVKESISQVITKLVPEF